MVLPRSEFARRDGLPWPWQLCVFLLAALAVFSRRPSIFLHWQFYAEDGARWFAQAYNFGFWKSLTIPDSGYLNTLQRLLTGPALLVPFRYAPLIQAVEGLILQVAPVAALLSRRCRNWGPLALRGLLAALYIAVPSSTEIHVVLTDSQWHLALLEALILFGEPPQSRAGWWFDGALFLPAGFCGPFGLMLVPLALLYWFARRADRVGRRWTLVLTGLMAIGASVQVWELARGMAQRSFELGATPALAARILGGDIFACALFGERDFAHGSALPLLALGTLLLLAIYLYTLLRGPLPLRMFLLFTVLLLAAALRTPVIEGNATEWELLTRATSCRYWSFPILGLLWSIAWCATEAKALTVRCATMALLGLALVGVVHDWRIPPMKDAHFERSSAIYEAAKPGQPLRLPVYPEGWFMSLTSKH